MKPRASAGLSSENFPPWVIATLTVLGLGVVVSGYNLFDGGEVAEACLRGFSLFVIFGLKAFFVWLARDWRSAGEELLWGGGILAVLGGIAWKMWRTLRESLILSREVRRELNSSKISGKPGL